MVVETDDNPDNQLVEIVYDNPHNSNWIEPDPDPFAQDAEVFKTMDGLSGAFKKRSQREFTKFQRGTGNAKTKIPEEKQFGYRLLDVENPPNNLDYLAKLYEANTPHKAAVDAKVANIVGLGWDWIETPATMDKLQKLQGEAEKLDAARRKIQRVKNELNEWLDELNEEDTFMETMKRVWVDYETMGNGYLEVGRITTGPNAGKIGYLGHVPAQTIRVRTKRDGYVHVIGRQLTFFRNFGDQTTTNPIGSDRNPNELIHFKKYTPTNTYYGSPDILPALNAIAGMEFADRFNLDYFEHKAVPRYVIVLKGARLSETAERRLIEFFTTGLKSTNHRTMYVPLPDGENVEFKMEAVEAGQQEGSFENFLNMGRDTVLMAHRVPITKVSTGGNIALSAARDADRTFKEQVTRPEQKIFDKKFNKIVKEMTDVVLFKLNELTLTDEDTQSKIDEREVRMGITLPNEVRRRKGQPGIPSGDKTYEEGISERSIEAGEKQARTQASIEQRAQARESRTRDQQRTANSTDSASSTNTRNPQGEGRQTG